MERSKSPSEWINRKRFSIVYGGVDKIHTSQEMISCLDAAAKNVKLDKSKLTHYQYYVNEEPNEAWIYPYPAETYNGNILDYIKGMTLAEEMHLIQKIGEANGMELTFPDIHATLGAFRSNQTKNFRENILIHHCYRNGLLIQKTPNGVDVRKTLGVRFIGEEIRKPSEQVVIDNKGNVLIKQNNTSSETAMKIQYTVGPTLQTEIPTRTGEFYNFKNSIPVDAELKPKGRGYWLGMTSRGKGHWNGSHFDNGNLSAVETLGLNYDGFLDFGSDEPLGGDSFGVLPIFTKENPKK